MILWFMLIPFASALSASDLLLRVILRVALIFGLVGFLIMSTLVAMNSLSRLISLSNSSGEQSVYRSRALGMNKVLLALNQLGSGQCKS